MQNAKNEDVLRFAQIVGHQLFKLKNWKIIRNIYQYILKGINFMARFFMF